MNRRPRSIQRKMRCSWKKMRERVLMSFERDEKVEMSWNVLFDVGWLLSSSKTSDSAEDHQEDCSTRTLCPSMSWTMIAHDDRDRCVSKAICSSPVTDGRTSTTDAAA